MEALHEMIGLLRLHKSDSAKHIGPVLHKLHLLGLDGWRRFLVGRLITTRRRKKLVTCDQDRLREIDRRIPFINGDSHEMGTLGNLFIQKALVFAPENDRDLTLGRERENIGGAVARRFYMLAVETFAGRGSDDRDAIGDGFFKRGELLARVHDIGRMNGHALALVP